MLCISEATSVPGVFNLLSRFKVMSLTLCSYVLNRSSKLYLSSPLLGISKLNKSIKLSDFLIGLPFLEHGSILKFSRSITLNSKIRAFL